MLPPNTLLLTSIDLIGTFVFALSGIELASNKKVDWFGAYLIGLVTAIGGGTVRDVLLDIRPFWMQESHYFIMTGIALVAALLFKDKIFKWQRALFLFDAIGLGLFTTVGISKSLAMDLPFWVCIVMGTVTGSIGGVIRDVLLNEVPLLLRKDIYALACVAGGLVYYAGLQVGFSTSFTQLIAATIVIFVRIIAQKYRIHLPIVSIKKDTTRP